MTPPTVALVGATAVLVWVVVERRIWPNRVCPRCDGAKELSPGGPRRRTCPRCSGTGRVRRWFSGRP